MKQFTLKISLCLILVSCKSNHTIIYNRQMKESFIYDFKITYFKKLLLVGYNKTDAIKSVVSEDQSGFSENILSMDDYNLLDSIVKVDNDVMLKDSIVGNRRAEGTQGKRVLGYALNKYESKWLDSLANVRSRIFMKVFKTYD